jgi:hypothetical protein
MAAFLTSGKPGQENIRLYHKRQLLSDPGYIITKSATNGGYGCCGGAGFSAHTFRMTSVVDNNACNNPGYKAHDTRCNYGDIPRGDHSTRGCHDVRGYYSGPH